MSKKLDQEHMKVYLEELHKEHEEHHENKKLKKIVVIFGGIFLILLMLSFVIVTFPIADIIIGQAKSQAIKSNQLNLGELSIIFEDIALSDLQKIYFEEQKVEFSACLVGERSGREYLINSVYLPKMNLQTFNHVNFVPCGLDTVIMLHSHPYKSCVASQTDINTLSKLQTKNPELLMVIMCEPERFSVYD